MTKTTKQLVCEARRIKNKQQQQHRVKNDEKNEE